MQLPHPISSYTPLTEKEARDALDVAVRLNLHRLPQLKGKGKVVDAQARAQAAQYFSDSLFDHLKLANMVIFRGPSAVITPSMHTKAAE